MRGSLEPGSPLVNVSLAHTVKVLPMGQTLQASKAKHPEEVILNPPGYRHSHPRVPTRPSRHRTLLYTPPHNLPEGAPRRPSQAKIWLSGPFLARAGQPGRGGGRVRVRESKRPSLRTWQLSLFPAGSGGSKNDQSKVDFFLPSWFQKQIYRKRGDLGRILGKDFSRRSKRPV